MSSGTPRPPSRLWLPRSTATTKTLAGICGIGWPGRGTIAGIGAPSGSSPSGSARAPAAGWPLRRAKGSVWNPAFSGGFCGSITPETASTVPLSNTSMIRMWYHIPCAKCG